jgi:hypothetical protein
MREEPVILHNTRAMNVNAQQYLLFSGFLYFVANVAVVTGYATGFLGHVPFSPLAAMRGLIALSCLIALAVPLLWWFSFRASVSGTTILLFTAMIVFSVLLDLVFYWLAMAAV